MGNKLSVPKVIVFGAGMLLMGVGYHSSNHRQSLQHRAMNSYYPVDIPLYTSTQHHLLADDGISTGSGLSDPSSSAANVASSEVGKIVKLNEIQMYEQVRVKYGQVPIYKSWVDKPDDKVHSDVPIVAEEETEHWEPPADTLRFVMFLDAGAKFWMMGTDQDSVRVRPIQFETDGDDAETFYIKKNWAAGQDEGMQTVFEILGEEKKLDGIEGGYWALIKHGQVPVFTSSGTNQESGKPETFTPVDRGLVAGEPFYMMEDDNEKVTFRKIQFNKGKDQEIFYIMRNWADRKSEDEQTVFEIVGRAGP